MFEVREMKDSGISFIGEIPCSWKLRKIKSLGIMRNGLTYTPTDICDELDGMLVLRSSNIQNGVVSLEDNVYVSCWVKQEMKLREGDILICSRNGSRELVGKNAIIHDIEGTFGAFMMIYRCDEPEYMYYILNSPIFSYYLGDFSTTTINQLTGFAFGNMVIPYSVDKDERYSIASYLRKKCLEMDVLITNIQKQVDILEQYKQSIITEVVTKGLNTTVEMRDSGIDWIGKIPAHWNLHPIYSYFGERKNRNARGKENNLLSLSYGQVIRKDINANGGLLPESFNTYNIVEDGDIIIRPTDLQNDKRSLRTGLVKEHGIITSAYIALMPICYVDTRYFHYLLHSYDVMKVFYNMGNGVRQGLNFSEFSRLMVFEPPYKEQILIADFLDKKISKIDALIDSKKEQLIILEKCKNSLIYEYVTGKKEVNK